TRAVCYVAYYLRGAHALDLADLLPDVAFVVAPECGKQLDTLQRVVHTPLQFRAGPIGSMTHEGSHRDGRAMARRATDADFGGARQAGGASGAPQRAAGHRLPKRVPPRRYRDLSGSCRGRRRAWLLWRRARG